MPGIVIIEIGIFTDLCIRWIMSHDREHPFILNRMVYRWILCYSLLTGHYIEYFLKKWGEAGQLACGVLAAYLLVAALQDLVSCEVYDICHLPALAAGLLTAVILPEEKKIASLVLFLVIQIFVFMKMYGSADGLVFFVCAVYESRFGKGVMTYLFHMAAAFFLLFVVQGLKRNINRNGNLKHPVPFVPYIAATVWFFL